MENSWPFMGAQWCLTPLRPTQAVSVPVTNKGLASQRAQKGQAPLRPDFKCILFILQLQKYKPIIIVPTFSSEKSMKNTEGVPRGRGLAAPESVCLLSISFR